MILRSRLSSRALQLAKNLCVVLFVALSLLKSHCLALFAATAIILDHRFDCQVGVLTIYGKLADELNQEDTRLAPLQVRLLVFS